MTRQQRLKDVDPAKLQELKEKLGGVKGAAAAPAKIDVDALFKKYADKDGKLGLDDFKKLYEELKSQMATAPAGRGNIDAAKLQQLKDKLKNKE